MAPGRNGATTPIPLSKFKPLFEIKINVKPILDFLFICLQFILPHHLLSRLVGKLAEARWPLLKNFLIKIFIQRFNVNMTEAEQENPEAYENFNAFFTRPLKPNARSIEHNDAHIISPVDGAISQLGAIDNNLLFQAKGHYYTLEDLLAGDHDMAEQFTNGRFATIYLSPKDYHRIHMPVTGTLKKMTYVPGRLFSVNPLTAENVSNLWARNERVVCLFETELGPMVMILIGAMIVASMETVWAGTVAPPQHKLSSTDYGQTITLQQGDEMGRFKLGSTVIMLFPENSMDWQAELGESSAVQLGNVLGQRSN